MFTKRYLKKFLNIFFLLYLLFFISNKVFAASVELIPDKNSYRVGDTINIRVNISSDVSVNAVSNKINFSNENLSIISLSKNSSIINLWAVEPTFSNLAGNANFEGVILNGYTGVGGNAINLIFKAKAVGVATVRVTSASVLANDGDGTDLFNGKLPSVTFDIEECLIIKPEVKIPATSKVENNKPEEKPSNIVNKCVEVSEKTVERVVEKIKEVEITNELPNYSLLVTIIIILLMVLALVVVFFFFLLFRIKKYFVSKLSRAEMVINKNFIKLEGDLDKKIEQSVKENAKISKEEIYIENEVKEAESEIIKEVEEIRKEP